MSAAAGYGGRLQRDIYIFLGKYWKRSAFRRVKTGARHTGRAKPMQV
jgi:hypothetical protein